MEEKTKNGYIAGIGSLIGAGIFGIVAFNSGWNLTGQVLTIFTVIFGFLGIGSLAKPDSIGQVAGQFLENIARNSQEHSSKSFSQKGGKKSKNVQGETVNYTENHYHGK